MPTYDYHCKDCGHDFEVRLSITQKTNGASPACPDCQSDHTGQAFRSMMFNRSNGKEPCATGDAPACCGPQCGFQCHE